MMPRTVPMNPATITAVKPTIMETRAPKMSRERTSRPRWSVPRRCSALPPACHAGGRKRSPSVPTSGLWGAMASARIATSATVTMIAVGMTGNPPVRSAAKRQARLRLWARLPFIADPRIDDGIEDVDDQVDHHDHRAAQEHRRLHHREVTEGDAFVEEAADAGPREDRLHHHGDVDHDDEVDSGQRQHRDERVLEGVLPDHQRLRQPLEPRQLDVLRAQDLQHGRAREPHVGGREDPAYRHGRQYEMECGARPRRGEPAEADGEEEDHDQPHPERRHRETEQREDLPRAVPPRVDSYRRDDPGRNAD